MSTLAYQYVVLRAVPRIEREEFVNIAVVLHCKESNYLALRSGPWRERVLALDPAADTGAIARSLEGVAQVCAPPDGHFASEMTTSERFGWLAAPRSVVVQPGPAHGGTTADPVAQLTALCSEYVDVPRDS
ncbi:Protein of unknown function (DUF3037) [Antricoccus suffuscus]|uniref:DUF3037 family protein n=1 Tax=Antricoccus suffuscus TaxID=1629062 RepID=A0A2T0Z047_9ACTN|nr:DUF3037 domain-containing protein [Antricoccus suffuscus]PRZ29703.1 Protein of unknown function (DUF3037) [Antricoccus suffuscus]